VASQHFPLLAWSCGASGSAGSPGTPVGRWTFGSPTSSSWHPHADSATIFRSLNFGGWAGDHNLAYRNLRRQVHFLVELTDEFPSVITLPHRHVTAMAIPINRRLTVAATWQPARAARRGIRPEVHPASHPGRSTLRSTSKTPTSLISPHFVISTTLTPLRMQEGQSFWAQPIVARTLLWPEACVKGDADGQANLAPTLARICSATRRTDDRHDSLCGPSSVPAGRGIRIAPHAHPPIALLAGFIEETATEYISASCVVPRRI
jgi:hypothetical protein